MNFNFNYKNATFLSLIKFFLPVSKDTLINHEKYFLLAFYYLKKKRYLIKFYGLAFLYDLGAKLFLFFILLNHQLLMRLVG